MSGFEGRDAVASYLASKGLAMTGENVRRALEQNAANPGLIKGLVNQAPPPSEAQGASTTNNQRGSAPDGLAQRMHQSAPQQQPQSQQPQAASDASQPTPQASSGSGNGMLGSLAALILGGGGAAGLAHMFGKGAPTPTPSPVQGVAPFTGVASPMPPAPMSPVISGVNPIDPTLSSTSPAQPTAAPNPGMKTMGAPTNGWPSGSESWTQPPEPMPQGAASASNAATRAPVSIVPREPGNVGGALDWGKILGELSHVVRR